MRTKKAPARKAAKVGGPKQHAAAQFKGDFVPADAILKYIEAVGRSKASRVIGVSTTTLDKAKPAPEGSGFVKKATELAARGLLREMGADMTRAAESEAPLKTASRDVLAYLVKVEAANRDDFLNLARIAKVSVTPI